MNGGTNGTGTLCNPFSFSIFKSTKSIAMKKYFLLIVCVFSLLYARSQGNPKPCTVSEASQFDFWVGNWDLYTADTLNANNTIYKVMDGCTVQENFSDTKNGYFGKSWSVYSPVSKEWHQTWVDNQGGYIALTGTFEEGKMTLTTAPRKLPNGKEIISRMIFYNIAKDSFDWDWQATNDAGATWKSNWKIHYVRKK